MWDTAENALRNVLNDIGIDYFEAKDEAAFYGPKLDILIHPAVGNPVALSTIQLDFLLQQRFDLTYVSENGEKKTPVVIHRAILGSLDRFIAFLLEETKGILPTWLAPLQVKVIPVNSDYQSDYAEEVNNFLLENGIKSETDTRDEKLGYRLREAQTSKIPYTLILGDSEKENKQISYRLYGEKDTTTVSFEEFLKIVNEDIKSKRRRDK